MKLNNVGTDKLNFKRIAIIIVLVFFAVYKFGMYVHQNYHIS